MSLPFGTRELYRLFDHRYIQRGRNYFREGRVEEVLWSPGSDAITGRVRGSGGRRYRVRVAVEERARGVHLAGFCSCPVGRDCKHVVAVLFHLLEEERLDRAPPAPPVRDPVESWLFQVRDALRDEGGGRPAAAKGGDRHVLVYLLDADGRHLDVGMQVAYRLKEGGYGHHRPFDLMRLGSLADPPAYLRPEDLEILPLLYARSVMDSLQRPRIGGPGGEDLLRRLLESGRCHWRDPHGPLLSAGEPRRVEPEWSPPDGNGHQVPRLRAEPPVSRVLPVDPPWYLDLERGLCGPAESSLPATLLVQWSEAPPVPPEAVERVSSTLAGAPVPLPLPVPVEVETCDPPPPRGVLRLGLIHRDRWAGQWMCDRFATLQDPHVLAAAWFHPEYGDRAISVLDDRQWLVQGEGTRFRRFRRDFEAEQRLLGRLARSGLVPRPPYDEAERPPGMVLVMSSAPDPGEVQWMEFMLSELPRLREEGWRIELEGNFPYRIAEVDAWHLELDETGENDWFGVALGVEVEGQRIDLLPILVKALQGDPHVLAGWRELPDDHALLLELEDGRRLRLPTRRIGHILDILVELFDPEALDEEGRLRVHRLRAGELAELGREEGLRWTGDARLREAARTLERIGRVRPVPAPRGFRTRLRPYQKEGVGWLQFLREHGFNGILADDMGLGKTVQTLAHILREKREGRLDRPALVVAPTSLMFNWRREAEQFAPGLSVLTLHGPERRALFDRIPQHDLVLTTYPLLPRDEAHLREHAFHLLILDEAQQIKNPKAKAGQVARAIEARHRLCLTGTPLENHLGELWSLFDFLMPGLLGSERQFRRLFRTPVEKHGDRERAQRLARRVAPFLLRRDKEQVATELPPKTEIVRSVPLGGRQRDLYETIRLAMHGKVREAIAARGLARSQIVILEALLKLRQVCCDPRLLKMDAARRVRQSAKLDLLMELLPELLEEGRRILLFSQFTSMLALIEEELASRGIDYVKLTGRTRDRESPIRRFQDGEVPLFLISLKAGGTGLNLTAADTVIHYDPWWNPAVENQATDRAHRIGQDKPVFVYRLLTEGTVEERIQALQARKRELAEGLFDRAGRGRLPGPEELEALFEPLG